MCLLFLYINPVAASGDYKFILANNRDEFYHRPAKSAHFWQPENHVIGGTDEENGKKGGTWLAMNRNGKVACLLNILQPPADVDSSKKGRGFLVNDYLKGNLSPQDYLERLEETCSDYNGFLLVTMNVFTDNPCVSYYTNRADDKACSVTPGIHVFGNSSPKKLWEKAVQGKIKFAEVLQNGVQKTEGKHLVHEILKILKDTTVYPVDEQIECQGKGLPRYVIEKKNASFYSIPEINYGTRTHTIILVDYDNNVEYFESTMEQPINIKGLVNWTTTRDEFSLQQ